MAAKQLLIDIGSTFTKVLAVDLKEEVVVASAASPTTVEEDVTSGILNAIHIIEEGSGIDVKDAEISACSSAAGGLRMVSIGLIPELSSVAARRAALGAGAKIVGHYCHQMTRREIREIEAMTPDIILLAGGTDGGNDKAILHNAAMLSQSKVEAPILVAGNKCSYDQIEDMFNTSSKSAMFVDNVMPEIGRLEVQPCRDAIRETFMKNIVRAKGLDSAKQLVGDIIMPTPAAVLNAATLLADGVVGEEGFGELIVVDVGGATTDVYSIAKGNPASSVVLLKGLPEPYAKRTVEGDLGVRHNIDVLAEICSRKELILDRGVLARFHESPGYLPASELECLTDMQLASAAVETSFERHTGKIESIYGPHGEMILQTGKDLTSVKTVIGTGGPVIHSREPLRVLSGVLAQSGRSDMLKPQTATFFLDTHYTLYAMGLLALTEPKKALHIMKNTLQRL